MITWFGGICWVPSAVRVKPSTMTMRVKAVTIISSAGTRLTTPSSRTMVSGEAPPPLTLVTSFWTGSSSLGSGSPPWRRPAQAAISSRSPPNSDEQRPAGQGAGSQERCGTAGQRWRRP